jgi:hypothetical protein
MLRSIRRTRQLLVRLSLSIENAASPATGSCAACVELVGSSLDQLGSDSSVAEVRSSRLTSCLMLCSDYAEVSVVGAGSAHFNIFICSVLEVNIAPFIS